MSDSMDSQAAARVTPSSVTETGSRRAPASTTTTAAQEFSGLLGEESAAGTLVDDAGEGASETPETEGDGEKSDSQSSDSRSQNRHEQARPHHEQLFSHNNSSGDQEHSQQHDNHQDSQRDTQQNAKQGDTPPDGDPAGEHMDGDGDGDAREQEDEEDDSSPGEEQSTLEMHADVDSVQDPHSDTLPVLQHPSPPNIMAMVTLMTQNNERARRRESRARHVLAKAIASFCLVLVALAGFLGVEYLARIKQQMEGDMLALKEKQQLDLEQIRLREPGQQLVAQNSRRSEIIEQLRNSALVVVSADYLIGIVYEVDVTPLPVILHKENLHEASDILKYARENNIPVFRDDQLAQDLWHQGGQDKFIPKSTSTRVARLFVKAAYQRTKGKTSILQRADP